MQEERAPAVRLTDLSKSYREGDRRRIIFEKTTATLRTGHFTVLLGKSGSGKSTLLNLLAGMDPPDGGRVEVLGTSMSGLSEEERTLFRRHHIGFVFQFFNLLPTLTVGENLLLPLELTGKDGPQGKQRARELLASVGLADRWESFPEQLSGGEQQRVAVARALVHDPELVLADEPTGNLDQDTSQEVLELLDEMTRTAGKTMVMVTHGREVIGLADRILTIEGGQLVDLPPESLTGGPV